MSSNHKSRSNNRSGRQNNRQNNHGRNNSGRGRKGSQRQVQQPLSANKQVDSHGPNGKVRGNVKQLYDKYKALAHECRTRDRTTSEAYGQYAHHYYTLYSEFAAAEAAQQLEREKEAERKQQEAAEKQSNIVALGDEQNPEEKNIALKNDIDDKVIPVKKDKPKNKRLGKKVKEGPSPELPLDGKPAPVKPKRASKSKKIKEEVAE